MCVVARAGSGGGAQETLLMLMRSSASPSSIRVEEREFEAGGPNRVLAPDDELAIVGDDVASLGPDDIPTQAAVNPVLAAVGRGNRVPTDTPLIRSFPGPP